MRCLPLSSSILSQRRRPGQTGSYDVRRAFTLLELIVAAGIVVILIGLLIPNVAAMRKRAVLLTCLTRCNSLGQATISYCTDNRGFFPAMFGDLPAQLNSPEARKNYLAYPPYALHLGPLVLYTGAVPGNRALSCPDNQVLKFGIDDAWRKVDFSMSAAMYLESAYLNPDLPQSHWSPYRAKSQQIDDVFFPSEKAGVFEQSVWHGWKGVYSPTVDITGLQPRWTTARISIALCDGHAEQLFSDELAPAVNRQPSVLYQELDLTPWGVRGRDRK